MTTRMITPGLAHAVRGGALGRSMTGILNEYSLGKPAIIVLLRFIYNLLVQGMQGATSTRTRVEQSPIKSYTLPGHTSRCGPDLWDRVPLHDVRITASAERVIVIA
jgi:hypothetical protein